MYRTHSVYLITFSVNFFLPGLHKLQDPNPCQGPDHNTAKRVTSRLRGASGTKVAQGGHDDNTAAIC